jgi:hypothetical protein
MTPDQIVQQAMMHGAAGKIGVELDEGAVITGVAAMITGPGGESLAYVVDTTRPGFPMRRWMWQGDDTDTAMLAGLDRRLYADLTPPDTAEGAGDGS